MRWHRRHGRHDLPWQVESTPYRVWVSEIMLQQTRVAAVVPYFTKFLHRFPDVHSLAAADLDAVLDQWSGLGYYARARNLHRAARLICERHNGVFPSTIEGLLGLPGIGRSTAGAILALSANRPHPILDGNARRVLSRYFAVTGRPGEKAFEERLWSLAGSLVPAGSAAAYTQAIMDLGATVCTRARPRCSACPVSNDCLARRRGLQAQFPQSRRRPERPARRAVFAMIENEAGAILLERRPEAGVWGGLWCFPECPHGEDPAAWIGRRFGWRAKRIVPRPPLRHTFSHFHLDIEPVHIRLRAAPAGVQDCDGTFWHAPGKALGRGVAAPVRKLIDDFHTMLPGGEP